MLCDSASGSDRSVDSHQWPVCVWDENPSRRKLILDALSALRCVAGEVSPSRNELMGDRKLAGVVLSLAVGDITPSELKLISRLKDNSSFVVCLIDSPTPAYIRTCCRVLLAGATYVVDSHGTAFLRQLCAQVKQAAERGLAAQVEEEALLSVMSQAGFAVRSAPVLALFRSVRRVSSMTDLPVLITGET